MPVSLYPNSPAVVAPASAADHNRVTCVPKPGHWSRLGYPGSLGKSAGTRVTLVTNWVTCLPSQDAGPGLASRLCRDKPQGSAPCLTVIEYDQEMHHTAKYKYMWRGGWER